MAGINPKQELFIQNYVHNRETFGNGALSYALAYEIDADWRGTTDQTLNYRVAQVNASRLLSSAIIKDKVVKLLNDLLKDEVVDAELSKVIHQDNELPAKVSAIREWYRVKGRYAPEQYHVTVKPLPTHLTDKKISRVYGTQSIDLTKDSGSEEDEPGR